LKNPFTQIAIYIQTNTTKINMIFLSKKYLNSEYEILAINMQFLLSQKNSFNAKHHGYDIDEGRNWMLVDEEERGKITEELR